MVNNKMLTRIMVMVPDNDYQDIHIMERYDSGELSGQ